LDGETFFGPEPLGPPYTFRDLQNLAEMGANYVNISHTELFTEKAPFVLDENVQTNLDTLLSWIEKAGMVAVISFRTGPGRSEFTFVLEDVGDWFDASYLNDSVWQDQTAQQGWIDMWQYTAQRYKNHPHVVGFDLMVEPNSNETGSDFISEPLDVWDQAEFYDEYGGTLYDWNQLYPQIVEAIREKDKETPILIGGMAYSAVDWLPCLTMLEDSKIVYTFHQYAPHVYSHQELDGNLTYPGYFDVDYDGDSETFDRNWINQLISIADNFMQANQVPVAVNEYGVMRWVSGACNYLDHQLQLFENLGINHAIWNWESSWEEYIEEVSAFNFRFGPDPNNTEYVESSDLLTVIKKYWKKNTFRPTGVEQNDSEQFPNSFTLEQNYPNPFNSETQISYEVAEHAQVILRIINLRGQQVRTLVNEKKPIGIYEVMWDGKNDNGQRVASGVYLYRLESRDFIQTRKMVVLQ